MNRDDIIRMARDAGITFVIEVGVASATPEWLERFAALVAAAEREECAKIAWERFGTGGREIAGTIRARGEQ